MKKWRKKREHYLSGSQQVPYTATTKMTGTEEGPTTPTAKMQEIKGNEMGHAESKKRETKLEEEYDSCHNHYHEEHDYASNVLAPKYLPILCSDEDDEDDNNDATTRRNMLGYAAYHGPSYIPAEVKDNLEHFLANHPLPPFIQRWIGGTILGDGRDRNNA